jgi:hypothetical protein
VVKHSVATKRIVEARKAMSKAGRDWTGPEKPGKEGCLDFEDDSTWSREVLRSGKWLRARVIIARNRYGITQEVSSYRRRTHNNNLL